MKANDMPAYKIKLVEHKQIATNTMAFIFTKPTDFKFIAGQYANFIITNSAITDAEGNTRLFTIASAPYEEHLMIATRMRDTAFKHILKTMAIGMEITMEGPAGAFILEEANINKPAVYLTGGIGVTPARSALLQATQDKIQRKLMLFYSNYTPEDAAFLQELTALEKANPNYKFIGTMTAMQKSNLPWAGEKGFINKAMLNKYIKDLKEPIYYLAGPPALITGLRRTLSDAGVPLEQIRIEEFAGY